VLILAQSALPDPILASDAVITWAAGSLDNAMLGPDRNRLAAAKPPDKPHAAVFWHVEKIARRPSERGGKFAPLVEEQARVIYGSAPDRIWYSCRTLALQPCPSIEIAIGTLV
jgi:hypothetical protein